MPLYEYQCEACAHRFERIQKFSDPHADTCPVCGGKVQKLVSSPAIQFKGSGFYITDYAKKSSPDGSGSGKNASSDKSSEKSSSDKSSDTAKTTDSSASSTPAASTTASNKE